MSRPLKVFVLGLSSGLGFGYLPWAPGTFGTLWGVFFFYSIRALSLETAALASLALTGVALGTSHFAEAILKRHDSSRIVIDEIAGYGLAALGLKFDWPSATLAFLFFRFFDIVKPFPIRLIDRRWKGAWGVVCDDLLAGLFANFCTRAVLYFWGMT